MATKNHNLPVPNIESTIHDIGNMMAWIFEAARTKVITIGVICLFCGCAGSPIAISNMSPEELRSADTIELCAAYAHPWSAKEKIRAELRSRDVEIVKDANVRGGYKVIGTPAFTDREWEAIEARRVFVGMSESALICSWGLPGSCGGINRSSYGPTQYAYQPCDGYGSSRFVYVEDGRVSDWSTQQ